MFGEDHALAVRNIVSKPLPQTAERLASEDLDFVVINDADGANCGRMRGRCLPVDE
jgi:hypothetical protein